MFFSNSKPKVTFSRCSSLCSLHLSFFIFLHAPRLLLIKLLLRAPSAPKFEGVLVSLNLKHSQSPPLPILCLSSLKSVFFSSMLSISHLSSLISQIYLPLLHFLSLKAIRFFWFIRIYPFEGLDRDSISLIVHSSFNFCLIWSYISW
jgi:hypothetical protein